MESTPRCLILGGTGFLGAHLTLASAAGGARTFAAARHPERAPRPALACGATLCAWDATADGATRALVDEVAPTSIVLAAALSRGVDCERDPVLATRLNATLPAEVATLARARGIRLIHVSTDLVFGGAAPRHERYREDDPTSPLHEYGRSKARGAERVLEVNPEACVVRLPLLFGDSFGRGIGASDALAVALERGEEPALFEDEWRAPLDVAVASRALLELVALDVRGLLHVAGSERLSRWELGVRLVERMGRDVSRLRRVRRADLGLERARARDATLDASRARALLDTPLPGPA